MRIIELLASLRELLSSELRALVGALPAALHALREALQATVDNCVALVTGDAVVPRPRRVRHRHRRIGKRKRLSRMNASSNLTCAIQANSAMAATEPVNALVIEDAQVASPRLSEGARSPLSLADLAYAHDLVERASRVEEVENDDERGARAQALATDIEHFLEAVTGNIQESVPKSDTGDDAVAASDAGNASVDLDNQEGVASPPLSSSALSDWGDATPGVAGAAPKLPQGWNTDWKMNSYAMLHSTSSSSDGSSVGEEVDHSTDQVEKANNEQVEAVKESPKAPDVSAEVPSSPASTTSSVSSCSSISMLSNGLSYRQLTQELAPPDEDDDETSAFYRVALQKLKEERKLRARLRAESMASDDSEDGTTPPTSMAPALNGLRSMRVTPLQPEYDNEDDDAARSMRKKKLESLRTRTTPFMIKIGKPLSVKSLVSAPTHDGPYFA